jgi:hypothetical protein
MKTLLLDVTRRRWPNKKQSYPLSPVAGDIKQHEATDSVNTPLLKRLTEPFLI